VTHVHSHAVIDMDVRLVLSLDARVQQREGALSKGKVWCIVSQQYVMFHGHILAIVSCSNGFLLQYTFNWLLFC
jgi:hypothetical protein